MYNSVVIMNIYLYYICVLALTAVGIYAQDTTCTTPNGGVGICKNVTQCSSVAEKLQQYSSSSAETKLKVQAEIQERKCGPDNSYKICCSECLTPDNKDGVVKHLRHCPHLWNLFTGKTEEGISYILSSRVNANSLDVCCGPAPNTEPTTESSGTSRCDRLISLPPKPDTNCCGLDLHSGSRITNGYTTALEEFPWIVLLEHIKDGEVKLFCSGTLISNTHVVTAAHCISGGEAWAPKNVRVGEWDTHNVGKDCKELPDGEQLCNDGAKSVPIHSILVHPGFNTIEVHNDIALIRLSQPVKYTDYVRPICLPSAEFADGMELVVAGWGRVNATHARSRYKQAVRISLVNFENCQNTMKYSRALWNKQMCAGGEPGKDSCRGDSGGPLMGEADTDGIHFELAGVVSFGARRCGSPGVPGIYTNVFQYIDWIQQSVRDYSGNWFRP